MAEGGTPRQSERDTYSAGSGDADESFCDPCSGVGDWVPVAGYCQVCSEFMCETCLRVHRKQRITKCHVIIDKNRMPTRLGSPCTQDLSVDVCKTHHPEIVKYYCNAHDVPGCADCMTLHHPTCERKRIQDISNGYENTNEFKHIDQKLQQLYQDLKDMEGDLNSNLKTVDKSYDDLLKKIKAIRKEVNEYLDQMEKEVTDKAAQMKRENSTELNRLIDESQTMKKEVKNMLDSIHQANVNINTLFVTTKQAKQRLAAMEREINNIRQKQQQQQQRYTKFKMSKEIHQIISAKTPLGDFSKISSLYRASTTYKCSIDVKCKNDKATCMISDSSIINKDRLVITDWNNQMVKLIDTSNNTVITSFSTTCRPRGVTALSTDMIAVTMPGESKIVILKVTPSTVSKHSEIKVGGACWGIAHRDGKLAVSFCGTPGRVQILDIQGKILHEIKPQRSSEMLKWPEYILFGQYSDTVIVSDYDTNKVSVITFNGRTLYVYKHDALYGPRGIVMTEDGLLCVCSWGNERIHVVSEDFKSSMVIINQDRHVEYPYSITYCNNKDRLYISNCEGLKSRTCTTKDKDNQIQVYDLNV